MYRFYIRDSDKKRLVEYPMKEVQFLCDQLGMDFKQDMRYRWFLEQALICLLPMGWRQEQDYKGKFQFHNMNTSATTEKHPLLYKFRKAFARLVYNDPDEGKEVPINESIKTHIPKDIAISTHDEQLKIFAELLQKSNIDENSSREDKLREVIKDAEEFYDTLFARITDTVPAQYENSVEYLLVEPEKMYETAMNLGINKEYKLVWIARMAIILPLPPFWKKVADQLGNEMYFNLELNKMISLHPARTSLLKLIRRLRDQRRGVYIKTLKFYDKECKPFEINMMNFIKGDLTRIYLSEVPDINFQRRAKFYRPKITMGHALNDIMVLNIAKTIGIKLDQEIHLLTPLYGYLEKYRNSAESDTWEFRYTLEGKSYWYNSKLNKSSKIFPYKDEVKEYINSFRTETYSKVKKKVRVYMQRHAEFKIKGKILFEDSRKLAIKMMENLILKRIGFIEKLEEIDLREYVAKLSAVPEYQQLINLIFTCPFKFTTRLQPSIKEIKLESDQEHSSYDIPDRFGVDRSSSLSKFYEDEGHLSDSDRYSTNTLNSIQIITPDEILDIKSQQDSIPPRDYDDIFKLSKESVLNLRVDRTNQRRKTFDQFQPEAPIAEVVRRERRISSTCSIEIIHDSTDYMQQETEEQMQSEPDQSPENFNLDYDELNNLKYTEEPDSGLKECEMIRSNTDTPHITEENQEVSELRPKFNRSLTGRAKTLVNIRNKEFSQRRHFKSTTLPAKYFNKFVINQISNKQLPTIQELHNEITSHRSIETIIENLQSESETEMKSENESNQVNKPVVSNPINTGNLDVIVIPSAEPILESSNEFDNLAESFIKPTSSLIHSTSSIGDSSPSSPRQTPQLNSSRSLVPEHTIQNISIQPSLPESDTTNLSGSSIEPIAESSIPIPKSRDLSRQNSNTFPSSEAYLRIKKKSISNRKIHKERKIEPLMSKVLITACEPEVSNTPREEDHLDSEIDQSQKPPENLPKADLERDEIEFKPQLSADMVETSMMKEESKIQSDLVKEESISKHDISDHQGDDMKSIIDEYKSFIFSEARKEISINTSLERYRIKEQGVFSSKIQIKPTKSLKQILNTKFSFKFTSPRASSDLISNTNPELKISSIKYEKKDRKRFFMYYVNTIGHPFRPNKSVIEKFSSYKIQPPQILAMGKRLGLKVSPREFESSESDLLWIVQMQLLVTMPPDFRSPYMNKKVIHWPIGTHPGDSYFEFMLKYHRVERTKYLDTLELHDQMTDLIYNSWLKFMDTKHKSYYYNFLTCHKSYLSPFDGTLSAVPIDFTASRLIELMTEDETISKQVIITQFLKYMYRSSDHLYSSPNNPSNLSKAQSLHYLMENTIPSKQSHKHKQVPYIKEYQFDNPTLSESFSLPSIRRSPMASTFSHTPSAAQVAPRYSPPPLISIIGVSPRNIKNFKNRQHV